MVVFSMPWSKAYPSSIYCLSNAPHPWSPLQPLPLVSASRHLVKKGRVIELKQQGNLFGRTSTQRRPVQLFSFNDLVIVGKKKKSYS